MSGLDGILSLAVLSYNWLYPHGGELHPRRSEMPRYDYDVLVIGAGQGGLPAAHMAANLGARVALIEQREVGGT